MCTPPRRGRQRCVSAPVFSISGVIDILWSQARELLAALQRHGFVPYHIDMGGPDIHTCCGAEYSLYNMRVPKERLPCR